MFRGLIACSLDAKGRITVPVHYRKILIQEVKGRLVVTIDTEAPCLLLYPLSRWLKIEKALESLPSFLSETRRIQRLLIGHATDVELDKQGRVLLPNLLREYADLDKNLMWVGQGQKVELWGETQWQLERKQCLSVDKKKKTADLPIELQDVVF